MHHRIASLFIVVIVFCFSCGERKVQKSEQVLEGQRKTKLPDSLNRKWKKGIDITANGSKPVTWSLEADFDGDIVFNAKDGHNLRLLPILDGPLENAQTVFNVKTGDSVLSIIMSSTACLNGRENSLAKSVEVRLGKVTYSGCGQYLYNNQLNDVWMLDKINGEKISKTDYAGSLPYLDIRIDNETVTGTDGCNAISGSVSVLGSRIHFSKILTKGPCANSRVSEIFARHVYDKLVDYRLDNQILVLYLSDDSKLSFTRKQF